MAEQLQTKLKLNRRRLDSNLERVDQLISLYEDWRKPGPGRRSVGEVDILRAAVVLLHASFEDHLREIAIRCVPLTRDEHHLNHIGFSSNWTGDNGIKLTLGALAAHSGRSVDELVETRVEEYYNQRSFSKADEVLRSLASLGVESEQLRQHLPAITRLMERRHKIVHRVDGTPKGGRGNHSAAPLTVAQVREWRNAVSALADEVLRQMLASKTLPLRKML